MTTRDWDHECLHVPLAAGKEAQCCRARWHQPLLHLMACARYAGFERTISRIAVSLLAPYSRARLTLAKLDLLTLRPRLLVGSSGSMMFRNLSWKALGVALAVSGEKPWGLYMCRMSAMKSSFSSGGSFMSGKGRAARAATVNVMPNGKGGARQRFDVSIKGCGVPSRRHHMLP